MTRLYAGAFLLLTFALGPVAVAQQPPTIEYAVKFVCGRAVPSAATLPVAPGSYYTAINVHNPSSRPVVFRKKFAVALPSERAGEVRGFFEARLGADSALEIDCQDIFNHFRAPGGPPIALLARFAKGFVIIRPVEAAELDIVAVYTAAGATGQVETMEIERVPFRRLAVGLPDLIPFRDPQLGFCRRDSLGRSVLAMVKNQGVADAGASKTTIEFMPGGVFPVATPAVPAGVVVALSPVPIPAVCFMPNCKFTITVDAGGAVAESDEGNNVVTDTCLG